MSSGDLTCLTRAVPLLNHRADNGHNQPRPAETCQVLTGVRHVARSK